MRKQETFRRVTSILLEGDYIKFMMVAASHGQRPTERFHELIENDLKAHPTVGK